MAEFDIDGVTYKSRLFDGKKQIQIAKRLLPAFTALIGVSDLIRDVMAIKVRTDDASDTRGEAEGGDGVEAKPDPFDRMKVLAPLLVPFSTELAKLSDADVEFILDAALEVTERHVTGGRGWQPVVSNGVFLNRDDQKFVTRLSIAWNVIGENFSDMFAGFGVDVSMMMKSVG